MNRYYLRYLLLVAGLAAVAVMSYWVALSTAHADPGSDMCGTGKYFNPYDPQPCQPTDRGAYPNYPPSYPGVPIPGYGGHY